MATYNPGFGFPPRRGYDSSIPHYGIDFPGIPGSSIPAAAKGVVWYSGWNDSYGNTVIIRHIDASGNAFYSLYAHMNGQDMPALGADVTQGQKIGEVGNTPNVGNHLHFEVIDPAVDDMSDPRFLSENPIYGGGPNGEIGLTGDEFRYDPDSFFDNWSVTDIFNGWITPFLVPNWMWSLLNQDNGERVCFGIDPSFNNYFTRATQWRPSSDPLTLDLDGDGIETVGINTNNPILFDHDGDGVKTATGWIKGDDGLLVLDRNNNGVIDNGRELFGDSTVMSNGQTAADGFAALADLDSNQDGVIDANDTQFANLKVWRDLNQDGISQANELSTLDQQNIASISLTTTQNNQLLGDGNRIMDLGTYTKTDGTTGTTGATGQTGDVDFAENTFYTDFTDSPPITPEAELLPNMEGSGLVRDLREAASIRGDLANVLNTYASATTRAEQIIKGQKAKDELLAVSF